MSALLARVRRMPWSSQAGTTLVELLIVIGILGVVLPATYQVVASVQSTFNVEIDRSANVTQAGLAMQQIEKEIQSAEAMSICATSNCSAVTTDCTTTSVTPSSLTTCYLVTYTQTNATTRQMSSPGPSSPFSCVEWRVAQVTTTPATYVFQSRRWQPDWQGNPSALVTGWRYVTEAMPKVAARFTFPSVALFGGRLIQVTLTVNNQTANKTAAGNPTSDLSLTRQLTGSNIVAAPNPCIPPNGTLPS